MAFSIRFLLGRVVVHQFGLQECSWVQSVCPGDSWWLFLLDSSHVSHVFRLVRCCGGNLENLWYDQYSTRRWIPGKLILYIVSHCHWLSYPANQRWHNSVWSLQPLHGWLVDSWIQLQVGICWTGQRPWGMICHLLRKCLKIWIATVETVWDRGTKVPCVALPGIPGTLDTTSTSVQSPCWN